MELTVEQLELLRSRFKAKYRVVSDSGCWEWTASLAGKGYGQIKIPGKRAQLYAHRLSYLLHHGPIEVGKEVLHKCDNPKCVNPDHLRVGTCAENQYDMMLKGRSLFGERNAQAIITEADVRAIRKLCAMNELPQWKIGQMFGIKQMEVSRIYRRERWAHVKDDPDSS